MKFSSGVKSHPSGLVWKLRVPPSLVISSSVICNLSPSISVYPCNNCSWEIKIASPWGESAKTNCSPVNSGESFTALTVSDAEVDIAPLLISTIPETLLLPPYTFTSLVWSFQSPLFVSQGLLSWDINP